MVAATLTIITESCSTTWDEHSIPEELFAQQTHYLLWRRRPVWGGLHLLLRRHLPGKERKHIYISLDLGHMWDTVYPLLHRMNKLRNQSRTNLEARVGRWTCAQTGKQAVANDINKGTKGSASIPRPSCGPPLSISFFHSKQEVSHSVLLMSVLDSHKDAAYDSTSYVILSCHYQLLSTLGLNSWTIFIIVDWGRPVHISGLLQ